MVVLMGSIRCIHSCPLMHLRRLLPTICMPRLLFAGMPGEGPAQQGCVECVQTFAWNNNRINISLIVYAALCKTLRNQGIWLEMPAV